MRETLDRLSKVKSPVCVTIILNTHKTAPENKKDPILLKNLISTVGKRLENEYDAKTSKSYVEKLNQLAEKIDHSHNDNGLILFVNEEISEYLRVPTHPTTRVVLDDTFATRSVIRALKRDTDYYILVLGKGKVRLLEASSGNLVQEIKSKDFPFEDKTVLDVAPAESANAQRMTNLTQEFFNRVDKNFNQIRKNNPLPTVIYSETNNYHQYLKEADYPNVFIGHVLLKSFDAKASNLVKEVWEHVKELTVEKNRSRITELQQALNSGKFLGDINEIWLAVQNGRGKTIFVEEGYFQPVRNDNGVLRPISAEEISSKEDINDIVDDMIEYNLQFGGDVVFLEPNSLKDFNKLALVVRY